MRFLFFLGHPAHFHLFKNIIKALQKKQHNVIVLIKSKDILETLCVSEGLVYQNIYKKARGESKLAIAKSFFYKYLRIGKVIKDFKPNILLGSEPTLAHLGKFFNIPSFIFSEDDVEIIPQFAKIAYPFVDVIISPYSCNAGKWNNKKISYNGYHKLAYLHPSVFKPDKSKIDSLANGDYFILRLTNLLAYHDEDRTGIDKKILSRVIQILEPYGSVYITSERPLEAEFEKYRLSVDPTLIHHILYYAKLYIGDSQSMAVESALLGTPGIRFNDFAQEIGVLNELERKYHLTTAIKTDDVVLLYKTINSMVSNKTINEEYRERAKKMLKDKINVPSFFVWFIENYPQSKKIIKENPDYQYHFK